ncbi:hypothetical protein [Aquimarina longa]|uniref:hypothetical protein n=1 Tax=Aquimarina longa TaxID=1080221 RepID=UPI0007839032|nr:hypothetical protein [Aquimarina longa]
MYDGLTSSFKNEFENSIKKNNLRLLIYSLPNGNWVVIGTKKIAINDHNKLKFLRIDAITGVIISKSENIKKAKVNQHGRTISFQNWRNNNLHSIQ